MDVRMKVDISGVRDGKPWPMTGEVASLPTNEAVELCAQGYAVPLSTPVEATRETRELTPVPDDSALTTASISKPRTPRKVA